jgi:ubiquinone/menaquinone biosynthesis C-methylase UbiE
MLYRYKYLSCITYKLFCLVFLYISSHHTTSHHTTSHMQTIILFLSCLYVSTGFVNSLCISSLRGCNVKMAGVTPPRPPSFRKQPPLPIWNKISSGLKNRSRKWFIDRAERLGVPWTAVTNVYKENTSFYRCVHLKEKLENTELQYPNYYTKPFHGYDHGNLNWQAAFEAEAATLSISSNYWKEVDPYTSEQWLRNNITQSIEIYRSLHALPQPDNIVDIGCSIGISTEFLKSTYKNAHVWGLDLSPYFLAIASYRNELYQHNIYYAHGNAERLPFSDNSLDIVTFQFVLHEVPQGPTVQMLNEVMRVLKPDGTIFIIDLEPTKLKSTLSQSQFRRWAFEVTEPHIYGYYQQDLTETMLSCGFRNIVKYSNDPLNSVWCAIKKDDHMYELSNSLSSSTLPPKNNTFLQNPPKPKPPIIDLAA